LVGNISTDDLLKHRDNHGEKLMTSFKILAATALITSAMAAPAFARDYCDTHPCADRNPVGAAADTAAGIAGAAIGTAGAIATAPFRNPDDSYAYDRGCRPGMSFRGDDGRRHRCPQ
jgi:hypothetical protein